MLFPFLFADPVTTWFPWSCILLSMWCEELTVLAAPVFLFLPGTDALWRMNTEMSVESPGDCTLYSSEWKRWLGREQSVWNLTDYKWQKKNPKPLRQILFSCILFWKQCLHCTVHNSSERAEIALHKYCMNLCVQTHTRHRAICKTWLQRVNENVEAFASLSGELLVPLEK